MTLIIVALVLAWLTALAGLTLAACFFAHCRPPRWLVAFHPVTGIAALACLWLVFSVWQGPRNLPFDAGTLVLTFVLVAGAFLFSLRVSRLPVSPFVVVLHGLAALFGCALLSVGLFQIVSALG